MKIKNLIAAVAIAALAPAAMADVTINITGATAFRLAAHQSIKNAFTSVNYAYTGTNFNGAAQAIFVGSFPGITGNTTIRTSWSGSVEGVRDLAQQNAVSFLTANNTMSAGGTGNATLTANGTAQLAFSDVYASSTPYDNGTVSGSPAGVIGFMFVANQGSTITNITSQQFRALAGNGNLPLSAFTGNTLDSGTFVYLTGRNDGSGTRVTVLAETGYGYSNSVQQRKATITGFEPTNAAISVLRVWPTNDGTNASFIYTNGADIAGNGGYNSGSGVSAALGGTSTSVQLQNAAGVNQGSPVAVQLIGYVGTSDANTAINTNGAVGLAYNGSSLTVSGAGITNPDVIRQGRYTLWSYEHLIWQTGTDVGDLGTVITSLFSTIPNNLGNAGLSIASMNVSRSDDGGLVGP